jgi:addiction module HigA family antidote
MTMKRPPHPGGVVLRQCIEPLGLTITDAAEALGVSRNTLSELVNEKRGISPEMAVPLSKVFGGTEDGWLVQQAQYDLAQVRRERMNLKPLQPALGQFARPHVVTRDSSRISMNSTSSRTRSDAGYTTHKSAAPAQAKSQTATM